MLTMNEDDLRWMHQFVIHHEAPIPDPLFEIGAVPRTDLSDPATRRTLALQAHHMLQQEHLELLQAYEETQEQLKALKVLGSILRMQRKDAALVALLLHVSQNVCLGGHASFSPQTLSQELGVDLLDMGSVIDQAKRDGLIEAETAWTGSWHRMVLTKKGRQYIRSQ